MALYSKIPDRPFDSDGLQAAWMALPTSIYPATRSTAARMAAEQYPHGVNAEAPRKYNRKTSEASGEIARKKPARLGPTRDNISNNSWKQSSYLGKKYCSSELFSCDRGTWAHPAQARTGK